MRLRGLRKVLTWGTFCPVCRTVYPYPRGRAFCDGDNRALKHKWENCDVVTVFKGGVK